MATKTVLGTARAQISIVGDRRGDSNDFWSSYSSSSAPGVSGRLNVTDGFRCECGDGGDSIIIEATEYPSEES